MQKGGKGKQEAKRVHSQQAGKTRRRDESKQSVTKRRRMKTKEEVFSLC